jgi:hypothetical protein
MNTSLRLRSFDSWGTNTSLRLRSFKSWGTNTSLCLRSFYSWWTNISLHLRSFYSWGTNTLVCLRSLDSLGMNKFVILRPFDSWGTNIFVFNQKNRLRLRSSCIGESVSRRLSISVSRGVADSLYWRVGELLTPRISKSGSRYLIYNKLQNLTLYLKNW